jgi:hypothetical protein
MNRAQDSSCAVGELPSDVLECECLNARRREILEKGFAYRSPNRIAQCMYGRRGARGAFIESVWVAPNFVCPRRAA